MSPDDALLVVIGVFMLLLVIGTPIAFTLAGSGALGIWLVRGDQVLWAALGGEPYSATASYGLAIVPMYLLLGMFALHGRLAQRAYELANRLFRRLPGGLGLATVGACAGFAAVSGSSIATAATVGRISVTEMRMRGYPTSLAGGIVAMAGTLGILIPPSIILALYGIIAEESVGALLLAGVVPGILSACVYGCYIMIRGRHYGSPEQQESSDLGSTLQEIAPVDHDQQPIPFTRFQLFRAAAWLAAIFVIVMAGIYSGQFTVIESAALGAAVALLMVVVERSTDGVRSIWNGVRGALVETASTTAMAFALVVGAAIFSFFLVITRVPVRFSEWVIELGLPPLAILGVVLLALLLLGTVLETISILLITVPLLHPMVVDLGFDGVAFAILFVKMVEIGLVTPPVGMNVYIVSGVAGVPAERVFRGVAPLVGLDLLVVGLLVAFPAITLWLPSVLGE